jgi:hypothetical protein
MRSPREFDDNDDRGERTPLLRVVQIDADAPLKQTPLPTVQVSALVLPWIAEAVVMNSISPYINEVRSQFGSLVYDTIDVDPCLARSRSSDRGW